MATAAAAAVGRPRRQLSPQLSQKADQFLRTARRLLLWSPGSLTVRCSSSRGEVATTATAAGAATTTSAPLLTPGQKLEGTIELDISNWCDIIDEAFLIETTRDCRAVCLTLSRIDASSLTGELLNWIVTHISPKLLELTVCDCPALTWNTHVKRILEAAGAVEAINLQKNPWVDDYVVDQVTTKFAKSLKALDLENCTKVTDNGLYHIARRCTNVRSLTLNCCPKVTDTGLHQLAKKIHLSNIYLCHNVQITDVGLERLIAASNQLYSVRLTNCPKLTDSAMEAMYEAIAAWGKRRNTKSLTLKALELRDNPLMTFQALVFLSTALPNLITLDLRDCTNIDLTKGMHEMERMRYLEEIYLGPSHHPIHAEEFLQSMLFHAANLKVLHLTGIGNMDDDDLAELISASLLITDLCLDGMDAGMHTIEAICSHIPNITKFSLTGSKVITDPDVRCLSSICLFLSELTLRSCPLLGDGAFSRCVSLRRLKRLNISYCGSPKVPLSGQFLGFFTTCPLEHLVLECISFKPATFFKLLTIKTIGSLRVLELKKAKIMEMDDVLFLLRTLVNCGSIDLTGSALPDALIRAFASRGVPYSHPFLSWAGEGYGDFLGFSESTAARARHLRFYNIQGLARKYFAARKIQRVRRGFVKWRNDILEKQRREREAHRMRCIIKIQSVFRMVRSRRLVMVKLIAGRFIVKSARKAFYRYFMRKYVAAKNFYVRQLKIKLMRLFKRYSDWSRDDLATKASRIFPRLRFRSRARTYRYFRDQEDNYREDRLYHKSLVLWEGHLLRLMLKKWKLLRGETKATRYKLAKMLTVVADLPRQNSFRQLHNIGLAENFYRSKLMVLVWICFADDFIRARKADLLFPRAESHFNHTFFHRVVRLCFKSVIYFVETKRIKVRAKALADAGRIHWLRFNGMRHTFEEAIRMKRIRKNRVTAFAGYFNYYAKMTIQNRLPINILYERHLREVQSKVVFQWANYKVDYYFHNMMYNCTRFKHWREMEYLAEQLRKKIYCTTYFANWVFFKKHNQGLGDHLYRVYCLRWAAKCIVSLKQNRVDGIEYREQISKQMAEAAARNARMDEDAAAAAARVMATLIRGVILLQAVVRGNKARKLYTAMMVQILSATQVLQNFGRRGLALLKFKEKRRLRLLFLHKLEDAERLTMRQAEIESQFYELVWHNATTIQRYHRGYKGRLAFAELAWKFSREKGKDYYLESATLKRNLEAAREALAMRERKRGKSATLIQKRIRGIQARARFVRIKLQTKKVKCTINVQKAYRRRLAMLKLQAMRRDKWRELRYISARRQRGILLRMIGLSKRSQQRQFAPVLQILGLDPISFNYRIHELIEETYTDLKQMLNVFLREVGLFRKYGFNKKDRDFEKRTLLAADGVGLDIMDACKIIREDHPFVGETGVIARIDTSIPGVPLYEIKLDSIKRQTFVHMTTDPLSTYLYPQPLDEIETKPKLEGFEQKFVLFGVNEGDPMYTRRNINAAWVIQRSFRCHRARKTVARRRFELWLRSCDRQWSFFNHLADTNTLTMQANYFLNYLGVRPTKPVFYDEVRHPFLSGRYESSVKKKNEKKAIFQEFESKYRQRLLYLQKQSLFRGKEYFQTGFDRLTMQRKLAMYFQKSAGYSSKGKTNLKDLSGNSGAKFLAQSKSMVTGTAAYDFTQFKDSPHVRYYKSYMYQGNWSGIPLVTPLRPHGEGLLIFMDGWGFAREDKVLYLEVCCARYLNPADLDTSDPYCDISCNATKLQTSVKWMNLNPVWHEKFEIYVTNPSAVLNITVYDKDYIGDDDFLGQISIPLNKYADGLEHKETFLLKGEEEAEDDDADYGEIDLKLRWTNRKFEDDLAREITQKKMATRLQAWARRIASIGIRAKVLKERLELLDMVKRRSIQITNTARIRIAKKKANKLRRRLTACIKIQCRARIRAAKLTYFYRRKRHRAAIKIQTLMRKCLAKNVVRQLKKGLKDRLAVRAIVIQKNCRRKLAYLLTKRMREEIRLLSKANNTDEDGDFEPEEVSIPPVSSWINVYGIDPEYGLKRNRRMTQTYFDRILKMQFARVVTRFGICYVDQFPPEKSQEDAAYERAGGKGLTAREDFLGVYFPPFDPKVTHRAEAVELNERFAHFAIIHIPTAVQFRKTVDFNVITIQCAARQRMARKQKAFILKLHVAFGKLQRAFRRRNHLQQMAACRIQALFHLIHAKVISSVVRRERRGANIIQSAYRCFKARSALFDLRCVTDVSVLKFSSAVPFHGPAKVLDFQMRSFWMAESTYTSEIRFEMKKNECIDQIWIQTSTHSSQPKFVEISTVIDKTSKKFKLLLEKAGLPFLKGSRWHKFRIEETMAKYFKFVFFENYGDDSHISVRQIRFVRLCEKSATIVNQPLHFIMEDGPTVGRKKRIIVRCEAQGWPRPTFQWYRNGVLIPGATSDSLQLGLKCRLSKLKRSYRCLKCKMFSDNVPNNAFHVMCGNCMTRFNYKDIQEYDDAIKLLIKESDTLQKELDILDESRETLESQQNTDRGRYLMGVLKKQIADVENNMQTNREARYSTKSDLQFTNCFSDEGVYFCIIRNIRGGSVPIMRKSIRAVVVVQHSVPYRVVVRPMYVPRAFSKRKKWTIYHSFLGTFKKGTVEGLVRIRYSDGAFYEGPYIAENWLDVNGHVSPQGKSKDHYGVYRCPDGRVFEGANVDNHFDPFNLQTFYRVTLPNSEVYEGMFCDEMFHGIGMYKFKDGSVYEGQWFKGTQFGHGHLRSSEGWSYEGYFDTNRRQGDGIITFADGAMWLGRWHYGKRQGPGVYISPLRDVFRGEVMDGLFHGNGEMLYSDGSRYTGEFKSGKRNGIGIFCDADGTQYYGNFIDDLRHGEHIIKAIIPIEEEGQSNLEIRVGIFDMGNFVKWKIKYSNPVATKRFVELFHADRSMFDSVYSMILARNLPNVPDGVDAANEEVQAILKRVRNEAGGLVGENALIEAKRRLDALLEPIKEKKLQVETLKAQIDAIGLEKIDLEQDALILSRKCNNLLYMAEKEDGRLEQFWLDEPGGLRPKFEDACKKLLQVEGNDFFNFRNHRLPPPFTKRILDGVALIMGVPITWDKERMLLADSVTLAREGDDLGLRFTFDCKLAFVMNNEFKIYHYAKIDTDLDELDRVMADPRMRAESYYTESAGPAGPPIVHWMRSAYSYIRKARTILPALAAVEEKRQQAARLRSQSNKKLEDAAQKAESVVVLKKTLSSLENEVLDLQDALARVNDMLRFLGANTLFAAEQQVLDYYQDLERKIEDRRDHFVVETALMYCVDGVESLLDFERKAKIRDALAKGEVYVEPVVERPQIRDWLLDEVRTQQRKVIDTGRTLGYSIPGDPELHPLSWEETQNIVERIGFIVMAKMNEKMNDLADAQKWATNKGKVFDSRFFYILAWKMWEDEGEEAKELKACAAWEEIFVTPEECAKMALEAKVSLRMAEKAREQGKIWAKRHRKAIEQAEALLAEQFAFEFPDETARQCMELMEDESPQIPPATKAASLCWARLNPRELNEARDERNMELGDQFGKQYGDAAGDLAFRIFNGLATEEEMVWYDFAAHWRNFHEHEFQEATDKVTTIMAAAHADAFPVDTADEAANIIEGDSIGQMIRDDSVKEEHVFDHVVYFNARCWGMRNVGLLRGATKKLRAKHASTAHKLWGELETQTDSFRKGSYLLTPAEIRDDSATDRFFGFRARLENKFAWLFGYLTKMHFEYYNEMEKMELTDPFGKMVHNIRPTKLDKYLKDQDKAFLKHKREVEHGLGDVLAKLSTWNSYFGKRKDPDEKDKGLLGQGEVPAAASE